MSYNSTRIIDLSILTLGPSIALKSIGTPSVRSGMLMMHSFYNSFLVCQIEHRTTLSSVSTGLVEYLPKPSMHFNRYHRDYGEKKTRQQTNSMKFVGSNCKQ